MNCLKCGLKHRGWISCALAKREAGVAEQPVNTPEAAVAPVSVNKPTGKDRHKPGYMKDYMAKRRAAQKGQ